MLVFCFVQVYVEFIDFAFVYSSDCTCIVKRNVAREEVFLCELLLPVPHCFA